MASWLTAQLKAAEGLLEAVDKTVSRTVGTLGLAEGESEQLTTEFGVSQSSPDVFQVSSAASAYQQPYSLGAPGSLGYPKSNRSIHGGAGGLAPPYSSSSSAAPTWDTRSQAAVFTASGPTSGRALAISGENLSGGAAGFTVKEDAPIPFGGPPTSAGPGAPSPSALHVASSSLGSIRPRANVAAAGTNLSSGLNAAAAVLPTPSAGPAGAPSVSRASAKSTGPATSSGPVAEVSAVAAPGGPAGGASGPGAGTALPSPPPSRRPVEGAPPEPAGAPAPAPGALGIPAPSVSFRAGDTGPTDLAAPRHKPPGPPGAPQVSTSSASAAPMASLAGPPPPALAPAAALGSTAATQVVGPTPSRGEALQAPGSPAPLPAGSGQQQQQPQSSGGASPAPVAALASATTAAASSLASATTSAVTHSLSFFNLVLDDPDAAAADTQGSGAAAVQQLQALSRTCDLLRKRLEASRMENEQLEDMLARAEVRAQQEAALVSALREEVAGLQQARAAAEGGLAAQLAVARASLTETADKYEASQRTVLVLEGRLAALEESSRRLMEQHNSREGGVVEALRAELVAAEARLAAESKAHQAARAAAAAREMDLEQQIGDSTAALGDLTRSLEEANRKCRGLEEEVVAATRGRNELSAQVAALQRRLEDEGIEVEPPGREGQGHGAEPGGGLVGRGGAAAAAAAAAAAELEVLRGELAQHQRAAQLARQAAEASQAQAEALAAEVEGLRQVAEQRKDTAELEAQLREVSDMLYLKQTQMERLAAEKAAQQLKTERELESVRQELAKLARQTIQQGGGGIGRGLGGGPGDVSGASPHDVIPMDALGEPYQRLVRHNRVGRAVKAAARFLDSTASTTAFVLRQYPLARLAVFAYALLIHLYVYLLIARMQRMATHLEAAAVAPAPL